MRQLTPVTNLVLSCLAALGLLGSLGLPWYAPHVADPNTTNGPVERGAHSVAQVFQSHAGAVSGHDALGNAETMLFVVAAVVVALAAAVTVPALRGPATDLLRTAAILAPIAVAYLALDRPGVRGETLSVHYGLLVALGTALFMASAAWHGSAMRKRAAAPSALRMSAR